MCETKIGVFMMKVNPNITWLPMGEKELAINPATGDWLLLNGRGKEIFLAALDGADEAELNKAFPGVPEADRRELARAAKSGDFLSQRDCGPAHSVSSCYGGSFPKLAVMNLTEDCNLKCSYCYVGAGEGQRELMKPETAFRVVDEFLAMNPEGSVNIMMHGGEPLLNYELVQKLAEYTDPFRDKMQLSIQTNATLLTEERVRFLMEHDVSVGVSLDGPPELHNQTRPLQSGAGSFDQAMRGIRLLQEAGCDVGVICVMTSKCAEHIDRVLDFFLENGIHKLSFSPFLEVARGKTDLDNIASPEQLFEAYQRIIDRMIAYNADKDEAEMLTDKLLLNWAKKIFLNEHDFMCTRAPCGCGRDLLGIGVNGDIYLCDDFINDPDFRIGSLDDGPIRRQLLTTELIETKCQRAMADLPRCRDCVWRSLCAGICYSGDYYSGAGGVEETPLCKFFQKLIPYLIQRFDQLPELPVLLGAAPRPEPPREIFVALSRRGGQEEGLSAQDFADLLRFHTVGKNDTVYLCGDEPTADPELPMMLRAACEARAKSMLVTNGLRFAEEDWLQTLFEAGLQGVWVEIPEEPAAREALAAGLERYFRLREKYGPRFHPLTLRGQVDTVDERLLPALKRLREDDQLRIYGRSGKLVSNKMLTPLMRTMQALCARGILLREAEPSPETSGEPGADLAEPRERLLWIDSENYAGRALERFPARLLTPDP